ncbi:hypothetical protein BY996DRAFT_4600800 [Phakopsora pachyrhizi]|uniref:Uncharacterized protein n=1 Tax=Phakopsora pachyrhizi TaxID=170000 RepID=A0AAV0ATS8_PHAPC|nr:hypothetical protein BY996DRAFT_4600800 [Phakopsora pachyrhizi]CAH7672410.1 hypothetical protein PPACK8108_LOCUS7221 [Phakopsora pachyrhizi]
MINNNKHNHNHNHNHHNHHHQSDSFSSSSSSSTNCSTNHRPFKHHLQSSLSINSSSSSSSNNYLQPSTFLRFLNSSFNLSSSEISRIPKQVRLTASIILSFSVLTIVINLWSQYQLNPQNQPWLSLSRSSSDHPQLRSKTNYSSSSSSISDSYLGPPVCDPFAEPGSVLFDEKTYNDANWVPLNKMCEPGFDYLSSLRNIAPIPINSSFQISDTAINHPTRPKAHPTQSQAGHSRQQLDLWGRPYPSLDFLRNKTILYIGDSVDRNALEHLWHLVGANVRSFAYDDINSEPSKEWDRRSTPWEVDLGLTNQRNTVKSQTTDKQFAGLNCRFINGFFYGLDDIDEFSAQGDWHRPGSVEGRIKELFDPMTSQFAKESTDGQGPAFISLQSGLWDLAFFGRRNKKANTSIDLPLTVEQLEWYKNRYRSMVRALKRSYPDTPIWIRMTHRVGDQLWASHDWQAGIKGGLGEGFVNFFTDVRVHQIRMVQSYVARLEGLPIFDFGKLWEGYQKYQDKVHPQQVPGGVLMNQAIIHHIWMESIGRKNWEPKLLSSLGPLPHRIMG